MPDQIFGRIENKVVRNGVGRANRDLVVQQVSNRATGRIALEAMRRSQYRAGPRATRLRAGRQSVAPMRRGPDNCRATPPSHP